MDKRALFFTVILFFSQLSSDAQFSILQSAISKTENFIQIGESAFESPPAEPYAFVFNTEASPPLIRSICTLPHGESITNDTSRFNANKAGFEDDFPNGSYKLQFVYSDGGTEVASPEFFLNLDGEAYPPRPRFSGYTSIQEHWAAESFQLRWDAYPDGSIDALGLLIFEKIFNPPHETTVTVIQTNLSVSDVSFLIPANVLKPGKTYGIFLYPNKSVDSIFDFLETPYFLLASAFYGRSTLIHFTSSLPRLTISRTANVLTVRFRTIPGQNYELLSSSNLKTWSSVAAYPSITTNLVTFQRTIPAGTQTSEHFRVRLW